MIVFNNSWDKLLAEEFKKPYYKDLREFLKKEYCTKTIYPDMYDIFNALVQTSYEDVKVVMLGQDPYHEPGQAHGLSFSVKKGIRKPPSLENIFKELKEDLGVIPPTHGCLKAWADRGVLLLNTVLTVEAHKAHSHRNRGWEILTDRIISILAMRQEPMVFILWGLPARKKRELINSNKHLVLEGAHPSPLAAYKGFFGGKYFSRANEFLREPINWQID